MSTVDTPHELFWGRLDHKLDAPAHLFGMYPNGSYTACGREVMSDLAIDGFSRICTTCAKKSPIPVPENQHD